MIAARPASRPASTAPGVDGAGAALVCGAGERDVAPGGDDLGVDDGKLLAERGGHRAHPRTARSPGAWPGLGRRNLREGMRRVPKVLHRVACYGKADVTWFYLSRSSSRVACSGRMVSVVPRARQIVMGVE